MLRLYFCPVMLPTEVLEMIFSLLPIADLFNVSRTCKHFNQIISRPSFLRHKKRYFKYRFNASDDVEKELINELTADCVLVCMTSDYKPLICVQDLNGLIYL